MSATMTVGRAPLGRGLDALFGETGTGEEAGGGALAAAVRTVPVANLRPSPFQPRRDFDEGELDALAQSIRENGVLQALLVREDPDGNGYQIIAGERRWRAAQRAQLHDLPVVVRSLSDQDALHAAIIENVQRADLNPVEEARGYRRLLDEFGHRQEDLAKRIGKSRSHIANTLRLLELPAKVQDHLSAGRLSAGHARAVLSCPDPVAAADQVIAGGLSVRATEALAKRAVGRPPTATPRRAGARADKDPDTRQLEQDLSDRLGLKIAIEAGAKGQSGRVTVAFQTLDQLDLILNRLRGAPGH